MVRKTNGRSGNAGYIHKKTGKRDTRGATTIWQGTSETRGYIYMGMVITLGRGQVITNGGKHTKAGRQVKVMKTK